MNATPVLSSQLSGWLSGLVDSTLDDDSFAQLQELLAKDRNAMQAYLAYMDLHASLPKLLIASTDLPAITAEPVKSEASTGTKVVRLSKAPLFTRITNSTYFSTAMVALVFYGTFALLVVNLRSPSSHPHGRKSRPVAQVIGQSDADWSVPPSHAADEVASDETPEDSPVLNGKRMKIASGIVDLRLGKGTLLSIEGPAEWSIDGKNRATLVRGKLVASVPHEAVGFTLETPKARIVDLGTEFGVTIADNGNADVEVLKGEIDLRPLAPQFADSGQVLTVGQSAHVSESGITLLQPMPGKLGFGQLAERQRKLTTPAERQDPVFGVKPLDLSQAVATQSSTYRFGSYTARNATDGNLATIAHTDGADPAPWWQMDLGKPQSVAVVVLQNRLDGSRSRLRNVTIKLLAADGKTVVAQSQLLNAGNAFWGGLKDPNAGPTQLIFDVQQELGKAVDCQYVRIERTRDENDEHPGHSGVQNYLTLAEVQVFSPIEPSQP